MEDSLAAIREANTSTSALLKIPGEIRNKIYRFTLVMHSNIWIDPYFIPQQRSLLEVCHQIRSEASQIYYGENVFVVASVESEIRGLRGFLCSKDKSTARMVSKLKVRQLLTTDQAILMKSSSIAGVAWKDEFEGVMQRLIMVDGTRIARELLSVGVPLSSVSIETTEGAYSDAAQSTLNRWRDLLSARIEKVMKLCGA